MNLKLQSVFENLESATDKKLQSYFTETGAIGRLADFRSRRSLAVGLKGVGKTAAYRYLAEFDTTPDIVIGINIDRFSLSLPNKDLHFATCRKQFEHDITLEALRGVVEKRDLLKARITKHYLDAAATQVRTYIETLKSVASRFGGVSVLGCGFTVRQTDAVVAIGLRKQDEIDNAIRVLNAVCDKGIKMRIVVDDPEQVFSASRELDTHLIGGFCLAALRLSEAIPNLKVIPLLKTHVYYPTLIDVDDLRHCCGAGGEDFRVFIVEDTGSVPVGTFKPGTTDYKDYSTIVFSPQKGPMLTLQFVGLNSAGGDNTALIDNVRIVIIDNVEWMATDQLGTPRMMFDKTGTLANVKRHDYLPFGEELMVNQGLRTTARGYGALDGVRQKFTSKERDNETGLDFFETRYYASTQGRFISIDPVTLTVERLFDPQRINLYAYCRNNPLAFIDPTGEIVTFASDDAKKQYDKYLKSLNSDKKKHANELATVNRLQNSEIEYRLSVGGTNFEGAEGNTTTDGQRINIAISNVGGSSGETFSLNSRFSHELEHGRQVDNGELIFYKGADGKWHPSAGTYDIGDEVKAWSAQLNTSTGSDYWKTEGGQRKPSLLRQFANAKTDDERAGVLSRSAYPRRNQTQNSDYVYGGKENYKPGQLVRTNDTFGRVNRVVPPRPK